MVSIITSTAERQAAIEFAKTGAMRPRIVGEALQEISREKDIANAMFEILETEKFDVLTCKIRIKVVILK